MLSPHVAAIALATTMLVAITALRATMESKFAQPATPTIEIAPGVLMPTMAMGVGDRASWISLGGRALDTAFAYRKTSDATDSDQKDVRKAIADSGVSRSDIFVITKVPCCPSPLSSCKKSLFPWLGPLPSVGGVPGDQALVGDLMSVVDFCVGELGGPPDLLLLHSAPLTSNLCDTFARHQLLPRLCFTGGKYDGLRA
jgi:hypothetical protein